MEWFHKVSRREPCPVCGKPDWCVVSNDGGTAICFRVESDRPHGKGGWVHVLKRTLPPPRNFAPVRRTRPQLVDMERVMQGFWREFEAVRPEDAGLSALRYLSEDLWPDAHHLAVAVAHRERPSGVETRSPAHKTVNHRARHSKLRADFDRAV